MFMCCDIAIVCKMKISALQKACIKAQNIKHNVNNRHKEQEKCNDKDKE